MLKYLRWLFGYKNEEHDNKKTYKPDHIKKDFYANGYSFYKNGTPVTDFQLLIGELFPNQTIPNFQENANEITNPEFYKCLINILMLLNQKYPYPYYIEQLVRDHLCDDISGLVKLYLPKLYITRVTESGIKLTYPESSKFWLSNNGESYDHFKIFISIPRGNGRVEMLYNGLGVHWRKTVHSLDDIYSLIEHSEYHNQSKSPDCHICTSTPISEYMRQCNGCDLWYTPGVDHYGMDWNAHNHRLPLGPEDPDMCECTCKPCSLLGHPFRY